MPLKIDHVEPARRATAHMVYKHTTPHTKARYRAAIAQKMKSPFMVYSMGGVFVLIREAQQRWKSYADYIAIAIPAAFTISANPVSPIHRFLILVFPNLASHYKNTRFLDARVWRIMDCRGDDCA